MKTDTTQKVLGYVSPRMKSIAVNTSNVFCITSPAGETTTYDRRNTNDWFDEEDNI